MVHRAGLLALLVLFLTTASTAAQDTTCTDAALNATMINCYVTKGFSTQDAVNLLAGGGVASEEEFAIVCAQQPQYTKAAECVAAEMDRCFNDGTSSVPSHQNQGITLGIICNDTDFNITCIAELAQNSDELQACIDSKLDPSQISSMAQQDIVCQSAIVSTHCGAEVIRKCDPHTADVFESTQKLSMPAICSDYPSTIVG